MTPVHGSWVWYELRTTDRPAAARFYGAVLGWQARDSGGGDADYTLLSDGTRDVAGLTVLPAEARANGARPSWVGYVGVADLEGTLARLCAEGGSVLRAPADIPGVGRFAVVADPQGAAFMLFHADRAPPPPAPPRLLGQCSWRELMTGDVNAAFDFYADLFGWTKSDAVEIDAMGRYQMFAVGDVPVGGMMTAPPQGPTPHWTFYFTADGIGDAIGRIGAAGGTIVGGPHEVPNDDWIVRARDPQGIPFALVSSRR